MYKILQADADTYINNRIIGNYSAEKSNVGAGGTLDLYKLHGATFTTGSANTEYSRALIHFDLSKLKKLYSSGQIDINHNSFFAKIILKDVYGGQPTPDKFNLFINPLSSSFHEGIGKDIVKYEDIDVANFITASFSEADDPILWIEKGCSSPGSPGDICDYFTGSFEKKIYFKTGEEDLDVDVTNVIKSILTEEIPDSGFRISFDPLLEQNQRSYFVKRFASRHAYDETKRPKLVFGFDDSIKDTSEFLYTDANSTFVFYNYDNGALKNIVNGSSVISGSNCILLKLSIAPSGNYYFTGSQYSVGSTEYEGIYWASGSIPSDSNFNLATLFSGSKVKAKCSWLSLDKSKIFGTPVDRFVFKKPTFEQRGFYKNLTVTSAIKNILRRNEKYLVRVNVFDPNSPAVVASRVSVPSPGGYQGFIQDACYQIRDSFTKDILIPFDFEKGSTRLSSDSRGMFFYFDASDLCAERTYVIDVAIKIGEDIQIYSETSPIFKVTDLQG